MFKGVSINTQKGKHRFTIPLFRQSSGLITLHRTMNGTGAGNGTSTTSTMGPCPCLGPIQTFLHEILKPIDPVPGLCPCTGSIPM